MSNSLDNSVRLIYNSNTDLWEVSWYYLDKTMDFGYFEKRKASNYFKSKEEAKDYIIEHLT